MLTSESEIVSFKFPLKPVPTLHGTERYNTAEEQEGLISNVISTKRLTRDLVQIARTVTLKPLRKTSVTFASNVMGIVHLDTFTWFEQDY